MNDGRLGPQINWQKRALEYSEKITALELELLEATKPNDEVQALENEVLVLTDERDALKSKLKSTIDVLIAERTECEEIARKLEIYEELIDNIQPDVKRVLETIKHARSTLYQKE